MEKPKILKEKNIIGNHLNPKLKWCLGSLNWATARLSPLIIALNNP